ncbi:MULTISPECIES: SDR family NAD(P)-dependent oxidoreductase [Cytobacillus]|uniref:Short-chain dehydrogenase n=1 Tax=Cytobacillus kochii TaxID=859143 RepID=A0A248TNE3_9BACI|nr:MULTISPECIES: SDR family oxidoreductase [Cytobacillus]ASV69717.1 hypothetical protein CKF48_21855 [Cytobacillus kochii]MEA1852298.1 SDR family oxidoreductase [Cytobacillus sp. OWB-43]
MGKLKNKIALVTGGGSGIGRSIVERFVQEEARVIVLDIDEQSLHVTCNEINHQVPGSCLPKICDVTSSNQVNNVIKDCWKQLGTIDILINNAGGGCMEHPIHLLELTEDMWNRVFDLNTKSIFLVSQSFIRNHVEKGTQGTIVNMASQAGINPNNSMRPHYSAAKAAVIGLTKHMSKEFSPSGFRINAIAPGYCVSGERMQKIWKNRDVGSTLRNVPIGRPSAPHEQAAAVTFLSSDDASYITGVTLDVSGGGF